MHQTDAWAGMFSPFRKINYNYRKEKLYHLITSCTPISIHKFKQVTER
jgi:hypothetical protein